jgi:hypothetical protein
VVGLVDGDALGPLGATVGSLDGLNVGCVEGPVGYSEGS